jgi:hypothetical protein
VATGLVISVAAFGMNNADILGKFAISTTPPDRVRASTISSRPDQMNACVRAPTAVQMPKYARKHPCRHPPIMAPAIMRMTAVLAKQTECGSTSLSAVLQNVAA